MEFIVTPQDFLTTSTSCSGTFICCKPWEGGCGHCEHCTHTAPPCTLLYCPPVAVPYSIDI